MPACWRLAFRRLAIKRRPVRPGTPVRPSPIECDPTLSGKEVLSVDKHPSDVAGRLGPPDSDPSRPAIPGCRRSPLAVDFHTWPSSRGQGWKLHSETVDLPRSARVLLRMLSQILPKALPKILQCPSAWRTSQPVVEAQGSAQNAMQPRESPEPGTSLELPELAALPAVGLAYD